MIMSSPLTEAEIFSFLRTHLYVAAVSDILDSLGYRNQVMHQRLRPLLPDPAACGFAGRARTMAWEPVDSAGEDPYEIEIKVMDSLQPGDVVVHSTDAAGANAPWGELMTTVAKRNGAAGCICDSNIRDCLKIIAMNFPVYYAGIKPVDSKGRGIARAMDVPVICGDVEVCPGDLVFADFDGIVVVPAGIEQQVLRLAMEKVNMEDVARLDLQAGKTLRETYDKYNIL
jgi:4-hydroxy-4-methyl-2-oxoglutarate aldolase